MSQSSAHLAERAETTAASAFEQLPRSPSDKLLFTPGPLTTSMTVKQAMLRDLGSRDPAFRQVIREVRNGILRVAALSRDEGYEAIPIQGCGTMGLESVLTSVLPPRFKLLVLINGAYGERIYRKAKRIGDVEVVAIRTAENQVFSLDEVDGCLERDCDIASVAVVHCETTSGILNPIESLGTIVKRHGRRYIVDSMSGFGGIEFDFRACGIDYLISSANKCIEGVPGFSFVIARRADLERVGAQARTVSLDLLTQLRGFEADGQFLYTPPTHAILAFCQALVELDMEGGVAARNARYRSNQRLLVQGMQELGFEPFVPEPLQSPIITTFRNPTTPRFCFERFYELLADKGFVIYGGKTLHEETFRIATIGRLFPQDVQALLEAICTLQDEGKI